MFTTRQRRKLLKVVKNEKMDPTFIWTYLTENGRHNIIDLMVKSDKKQIKEVRIKRQLVPDLVVHNAIIKYLEKNRVKVIREDIKK